MAMDKEAKSQCAGGWSFFLLSIGLFTFIPGTIILGIYATDDGYVIILIIIVYCILEVCINDVITTVM